LPVLEQHLASCESCRATFAEEQSLFAAIDSGLRAAANPELPATLMPRVRVALNNELAPQPRRLSLRIWGFACVAVTACMILALLYLPLRRPSIPLAPVNVSLPPVITPANTAAPSTVNTSHPGAVTRLQHSKEGGSAEIRTSAAGLPEVIVAPEEGAALLRYEESLLRRSGAGIQLATARFLDLPKGIEPLEIATLELGDLAIPPLAKSESDGDSK